MGNRAGATYVDSMGQTQNITSNLVTTVVQQVAAVSLVADGTKTQSPGSTAYFPHTLTNLGNGTDTFNLATVNLGSDTFDFSGITIYPDLDGNGVPDNLTPITTTGSVPAGGVFRFVVAADVPTTVTNGDIGQLTITATSTHTATISATNTDTVNVTTLAAINIKKAISASSGPSPSGPYTYTLTYTNISNTIGASLTITDTIPAGMTYVAGSGRWSTSGATALTDAAGGDPAGIDYSFNAGTITAVIDTVPANFSGTLTFQVNVDSDLSAQIINNTANYSYLPQVGADEADRITDVTNTVPFEVTKTPGVTFDGDEVDSAPQGGIVTFNNVLTNTGNYPDIYNITISIPATNPFPAGTTYTLYKSDGVTPLLDTNNDGIPDTGVVNPGATYTVVLKAKLPTGASGVGPYKVEKIATSASSPTTTDTAVDTLTQITPSTVDVTNDVEVNEGAGTGDGLGIGPEALPVRTNNTNPGDTTRFTLYINNTSGIADTYNLAASTDNTFNTITLPAGYSVKFTNAADAVVTNTGIVPAGTAVKIYADVTTPANAAPGVVNIYFRAISSTTGAKDIKHDAVNINTIRNLTINPDNTGTIYPGGSIVYTHVITNNGNVLEGDGTASSTTIGMTNSASGFTSVLYWDKDNNGILDPNTDPMITDLSVLTGGSNGASTAAGLDPGESARIFVKVYAPAGAPDGTVNVTTITATTDQGTYSAAAPAPAVAVDTTTIITAQMSIVKEQALDANNDGVPDTAYSQNTITTGAIPGASIRYRITVTNAGTAAANNVVISDDVPAYTVYTNGDGTTTPYGVAVYTKDGGATYTAATAPSVGATGLVSASIGTLAPSQTAVLYFGIKIQ